MSQDKVQKAPWKDRQLPTSLRTPPILPSFQWENHPNRSKWPAGMAAPSRGGFLAVKARGVTFPGDEAIEVMKGNDPACFTHSLTVAILAVRRRWERKLPDARTVPVQDSYKPGDRLRTEYMLLIRGDSGDDWVGPVRLTMVGRCTDSLNLAPFRLRTQQAGADAALFWIDIYAGEMVEVGDGQGGMMTPIVPKFPEDLVNAYIGNQAVDYLVSIDHQIEGWKDAWACYDLSNGAAVVQKPEAVTSVSTQKYGQITFAELFQRDHDYAMKVAAYVIEHSTAYTAEQVAAARAMVEQTVSGEDKKPAPPV